MKKISLIALLLAVQPSGAMAQKENPRGIYKLITTTGKQGEAVAPYDQYKICTDTVTLTLGVQGMQFLLSKNDSQIFNYTGDQPKAAGDKSSLIYDSNAERFTLKWWSSYKGHALFPENDWCLERYMSGKYSIEGKMAVDALTGAVKSGASNPLLGTWRIIGYIDELRDEKTVVPKLLEDYPKSRYYDSFVVFAPEYWTLLQNRTRGVMARIQYQGGKSFTLGNEEVKVKRLTKDRIAIEEKVEYRVDWMILERLPEGQSVLESVDWMK